MIINILAINTFKEIMRDKILYSLIVFSIILMGLSIALSDLSFGEKSRITLNFGLTAIHISSVILSIFIGSSLVLKELKNRTIMTLLTRPLSRSTFILGKFVGLLMVIVTLLLGLSFVLFGIMFLMSIPVTAPFFIAIYGIILEAAVLTSLTLFFSSLSKAFLAISFSIGVFFTGHWIESFHYFSTKGGLVRFQSISDSLFYAIPNLERFNWRSEVIYNRLADTSTIASASFYAVILCAFLLTLAFFVFTKKDLA
ncbi:MAG: ABC transporter permease [Bdellovibrionaceae bacterium]|nr:ABC transporter permease [Pseudobdellovibrionaceae bacterium]